MPKQANTNDTTTRLITHARPAPSTGYKVPAPGSCVGQVLLQALDGGTAAQLGAAYLAAQRVPDASKALGWGTWYMSDYAGALCAYGYDIYLSSDGIYTAVGPTPTLDWITDARMAISALHTTWARNTIKALIGAGQRAGYQATKAVAAKAAKVADKRMRMASARKRSASKKARAKIRADLGFTS